MSVHILIITHDEVGQALLKAAEATFGELPLPTRVFQVERNQDPQVVIAQLRKILKEMEPNDGVLIFTDIFGSTPCNIAQALHDNPNTRLISGLNLPMLIRTMNYPGLDLNSLVAKAISGGREGIMDCKQELS